VALEPGAQERTISRADLGRWDRCGNRCRCVSGLGRRDGGGRGLGLLGSEARLRLLCAVLDRLRRLFDDGFGGGRRRRGSITGAGTSGTGGGGSAATTGSSGGGIGSRGKGSAAATCSGGRGSGSGGGGSVGGGVISAWTGGTSVFGTAGSKATSMPPVTGGGSGAGGSVAGSRISRATQTACPVTDNASGRLISLTSNRPPRRPERL
jgi:hypothetical protein